MAKHTNKCKTSMAQILAKTAENIQDKIDDAVIAETDRVLAEQGLIMQSKQEHVLLDKPKNIVAVKPNKDGTVGLTMHVVEKEAQPAVVTLPNGTQVPLLISGKQRRRMEAEVKRAIKKGRPIDLSKF